MFFLCGEVEKGRGEVVKENNFFLNILLSIAIHFSLWEGELLWIELKTCNHVFWFGVDFLCYFWATNHGFCFQKGASTISHAWVVILTMFYAFFGCLQAQKHPRCNSHDLQLLVAIFGVVFELKCVVITFHLFSKDDISIG